MSLPFSNLQGRFAILSNRDKDGKHNNIQGSIVITCLHDRVFPLVICVNLITKLSWTHGESHHRIITCIHVVFVGSLLSLSGFAQGHWLATGHFILICCVFSTIMKGKVAITLETTTKTVIIQQKILHGKKCKFLVTLAPD